MFSVMVGAEPQIDNRKTWAASKNSRDYADITAEHATESIRRTSPRRRW